MHQRASTDEGGTEFRLYDGVSACVNDLCAQGYRARAGPCQAHSLPALPTCFCANNEQCISCREVQLLGKTRPRDIIMCQVSKIPTASLIAKAGYHQSSPSSCLTLLQVHAVQQSGVLSILMHFHAVSAVLSDSRLDPDYTYVFLSVQLMICTLFGTNCSTFIKNISCFMEIFWGTSWHCCERKVALTKDVRALPQLWHCWGVFALLSILFW